MLYLRLVNATLRLWIKPLWKRSPTAAVPWARA